MLGKFQFHLGLLIFVVALALIPDVRPSFSESLIVSKNFSEKKFLDLFTEKTRLDETKTILENRQILIRAYIMQCCRDKDDAVKLLKSHGFKVRVVSDPAVVPDINRQYEQSKNGWLKSDPSYVKEDYDEFIRSKRGFIFPRIWDWFLEYRVSLYIKDGSVRYVSTYEERNLPF